MHPSSAADTCCTRARKALKLAAKLFHRCTHRSRVKDVFAWRQLAGDRHLEIKGRQRRVCEDLGPQHQLTPRRHLLTKETVALSEKVSELAVKWCCSGAGSTGGCPLLVNIHFRSLLTHSTCVGTGSTEKDRPSYLQPLTKHCWDVGAFFELGFAELNGPVLELDEHLSQREYPGRVTAAEIPHASTKCDFSVLGM